MKSVLLAIGILALITLPLTSQIPLMLKVGAPHYGRVIDHDSGEGIPGVTLIAMHSFSGGGWSGAPGGCTLVAVTGTDENGDFRIAQTYAHTNFNFPGNNPEQYWTLYAGKDGYFQIVDQSPLTLEKIAQFSHSLRLPQQRGASESNWRGLKVEFAPIQMAQVNLTFEENVAMFDWRGSRWALGFCRSQPDIQPLLRNQIGAFYAVQEQYVCNAAPSLTTDMRTVVKLALLAPSGRDFWAALKAIYPNFPSDSADRDDPFPMTDLCSVMKAGDAPGHADR